MPTPAPLVAALAIATAAITLAYLLSFSAYGLQVEDEGTLLYALRRVVEGQIPYVDFFSGYMPGYFYLAAPLLALTGNVAIFRIALACVHALTVAGMVVLVARVGRPLFAVALPLLYLVFMPVFPGSFCSFNIPYPSWLATVGWIAAALALLAYVDRRRRIFVALAGVSAAFGFSMKPNAGLFTLAAAAGVLLLVEPGDDRDSRAGSFAWWTLWAGVIVGTVATIGRPRPIDAIVYYLPLVALMAILLSRRNARSRLIGDAVVLLGTFAAATLPWLAFFLVRLGSERFLREMLYIGSNAAQVFYSPYPNATPWAWVVTALVLGAGWAGALASRQRVSPRLALMCVAGVLGAVVIAAVRLALMPERFAWSVIWQLESAAFPLTLATEAVGLAWLWRRRHSRAIEAPAALLVCGVFMHLQLYPRADFMHLVSSGPLLAIFAMFLLDRACRWWENALRDARVPRIERAVGPVAVAVFSAAIAIRLIPTFAILGARERFTLPFAVAPLWIEGDRAADARALGTVASTLAEISGAHAPSLGFPALDLVLFLAGARSVAPYTYFFPGRPNHLEEAAILDTLAAAPPAAVVSLNREFTFFDAAQSYFFLLRQFMRDRYGLDGRFERYDLLRKVDGVADERRRGAPNDGSVDTATRPTASDVAGARAELTRTSDVQRRLRAITVLAGAHPADVADVLLVAASDDDAVIRQAAVRALLTALSHDAAPGLEAYVDAAKLDRRQQTLLLRAIRDLREPGAASYLFHAARSPDERLRQEALGAMLVVRASMIARSNLWAGPEDPTMWPGRAGLVDSIRTTLAAVDAPAQAVGLAAELAGRLGDADTVPALRAALAREDPIAVSSARSLAVLAPDGLACELTTLLEERATAVDVEEVVPSVLAALARQPAPIGPQARACVAAAVEHDGRAQADAVWITAALDDAAFAPTLRTLLTSPSVEVRRATAWALGEIAHDTGTTDILERTATNDPDPMTRDLASAAAAKLAGRRATAFGRRAASPAVASMPLAVGGGAAIR